MMRSSRGTMQIRVSRRIPAEYPAREEKPLYLHWISEMSSFVQAGHDDVKGRIRYAFCSEHVRAQRVCGDSNENMEFRADLFNNASCEMVPPLRFAPFRSLLSLSMKQQRAFRGSDGRLIARTSERRQRTFEGKRADFSSRIIYETLQFAWM
jgi:hypothetical protein